MVTVVTKTISLTGTPDYSTLQAWEDAAPANLVTADQVWKGVIDKATDSFSGTGPVLDIAGSTSDATRYKELTVKAGVSFVDSSTNVLRFSTSQGASLTATTGIALTLTESYARLSRLQMLASTGVPLKMAGGIGQRVDNVLGQVPGKVLDTTLAGTGDVSNSVFISTEAGTTELLKTSGASTINFHNCTFAKPSDITSSTNLMNLSASSTTNFTNCALYGGTNVQTGGGTANFTTCRTNDTTPPTGCTTVSYTNAVFVNSLNTTQDFRIQSSSQLKDGGTTDVTWASTDIFGTVRPQGSTYDVGAYEAVSNDVSGTLTTTLSSIIFSGVGTTSVGGEIFSTSRMLTGVGI